MTSKTNSKPYFGAFGADSGSTSHYIQIKMFDDRLEVDSPGIFAGGVKKENIRYIYSQNYGMSADQDQRNRQNARTKKTCGLLLKMRGLVLQTRGLTKKMYGLGCQIRGKRKEKNGLSI